MTYTTEIIIGAPLEVCIEKFDHLNIKHWQHNLDSLEHIYGIPGECGAKMKLNCKNGRNPMSIVETITHKNLPHEFHCYYDAKGIHDIQKNYFTTTSEDCTKWRIVNEFIPLNFKMRLMLWMMPQTFKKQSLQYMTNFKNFVEKGISVCAN